jgi:hypothetical protein
MVPDIGIIGGIDVTLVSVSRVVLVSPAVVVLDMVFISRRALLCLRLVLSGLRRDALTVFLCLLPGLGVAVKVTLSSELRN